MGLDDFQPSGDEPNVEAQADVDEDLFDFPVPDRHEQRSTEEEELADALEAVEEIAASMSPELAGLDALGVSPADDAEELAVPAAEDSVDPADPAPAEPASATPDFDEDEDLFGFAPVSSKPPAVSADLEEDLDEIFGDLGAPGLDDEAIGELLDAEDAALAEAEAHSITADALAAATPPEPAPSEPVREAAPASGPTAPATAAARAAGEAEAGGKRFTLPTLPTGRALTAVSQLGGRLKGTPILWLVGLMVSTNLLMLVLFWSSLGSVRDLVVETIQKVASAPAAGGPGVQRLPLRETLQRNAPIVQAAEPNEAALMAEDTLATSQDLITQGRFDEARRDLFVLLASIDAVPSRDRDLIEAEANHLIGECFRARADALAAARAGTPKAANEAQEAR